MRSAAFTLVEIVIVVVMISLLASFAGPPVQRMREKAALQNSRHLVTSALALASATGPKWGRTAVMGVDTTLGTLRVVVDTGEAATGADTLLVREFTLPDGVGLRLRSNRDAFCFNSRGVGTTDTRCSQTGGWIAIRHGAALDTVTVNSLGRVVR